MITPIMSVGVSATWLIEVSNNLSVFQLILTWIRIRTTTSGNSGSGSDLKS